MSTERRSPRRVHTCNICGGPQKVSYMEWNDEEKKFTRKEHTVPCLGHEHLHPSLWNMREVSDAGQEFVRTLTFDDYRKTEARRKTNENKKSGN